MARRRFVIASAISENYVLPLRVMLMSLRRHLHPDLDPVLYLLHTGLSGAALDSIGRIAETIGVVPDAVQLAQIPRHPSLPPVCAFPLLVADLLKEQNSRILFLDADLLIVDDLAKLDRFDLGGNVLAAAPDLAIPTCGSPRGLPAPGAFGLAPEAPYCNAGVMLIDIEKWLRQRITPRCAEYVVEAAGCTNNLYHQEALNAVLGGRWARMPAGFNMLAGPASRGYDGPVSIVHFAGRFKPWRFRTASRWQARYDEFLELLGEPAPRPTMTEQALSAYDHGPRAWLYPLERAVWGWQWI